MSRAYRLKGLKDGDLIGQARFTDIDCSKDKSLTVQAPADEVDINKIMARIEKGHPVMTSTGEPFYRDVSEFGDLQDAIIKVQEAEELFMQVPAKTRELFNNDPVNFVEFMSDPANTNEAIKLGLALPRTVVPEPPADPAGAPPAPK